MIDKKFMEEYQGEFTALTVGLKNDDSSVDDSVADPEEGIEQKSPYQTLLGFVDAQEEALYLRPGLNVDEIEGIIGIIRRNYWAERRDEREDSADSGSSGLQLHNIGNLAADLRGESLELIDRVSDMPGLVREHGSEEIKIPYDNIVYVQKPTPIEVKVTV